MTASVSAAVAATRLRIGVVQFAPKHADVAASIAKARSLVAHLKPGDVDLLCFPEMAFSGYVFSPPAAVRPLLERPLPDPAAGPTTAFLSSLARSLRCYTAAGLPLALPPHISPGPSRIADPSFPPDDIYGRSLASDPVGFNGAVLVGPDGALAAQHAKVNLFRADVPWARPGDGFATHTLPSPLGRTTLAICMDLNPASDHDSDVDFELAEHCLRERTRVLILLNSWLDSGEDGDGDGDGDGDEDWRTLGYWAYRLRPLYAPAPTPADNGHETVVVACNRIGSEAGMTFAGSSALFRCRRGAGRPQLLDAMGRREEGVRIWAV